MNEGVIKTTIEPRRPDTKFREAETEAKPDVKDITKPKPNPSKTAFKEAETEAEARNFSILGSRSRPRSQHFRETSGFRRPKPKPKPASNPTLLGTKVDDLTGHG